MSVLNTQIKHFGKLIVPDQEIGNTRLNVFPFEQTSEPVTLPIEYKRWEKTLNQILSHIPIQEGATQHCITINSEFFTEDGFQRNEGVHMDGNFCVDLTFKDKSNNPMKSWGGISPAPTPQPQPGWGGLLPSDEILTEQPDNSHVVMDWVLPYDIVIPIAKYLSDTKGGLFVVSSNVGTQAWSGRFEGHVKALGSFDDMLDQLTDENSSYVPKNELVFLTSNTPHQTLKINKGERRTFMRLTLNHNYDNSQILNQRTS